MPHGLNYNIGVEWVETLQTRYPLIPKPFSTRMDSQANVGGVSVPAVFCVTQWSCWNRWPPTWDFPEAGYFPNGTLDK